nr:hypothetical protein [uncultured Allomuricauda sp.]
MNANVAKENRPMIMEVIKLTNSKGMNMEVCSYGATLISLKVPDRNNHLVNAVVGLDSA